MSKIFSNLSILCLTIIISANLFSQQDVPIPGNTAPISEIFYSNTTIQQIKQPISFFQFTAEQWRAKVDSIWGPGLPTTTKLQIFDAFWNKIDSSFACFHDIPDNWLALKNQYRSEVAAGVSKGRFAAIMNVLALSLKDLHTNPYDKTLFATLPVTPGMPFLYIGGSGTITHIGFGLTPMPDSSLLVYKVIPNHPLGIQPGDIVLGYDGIPWKILVYQLLDYQLPFGGPIGSSPSAFTHNLLSAAGRNRHLFNNIDIIKYSTGDTVHLSTASLYGLPSLFCDEQMDIAGVPKPDYNAGQYVSYGIMQGTNIGYIYGLQWTGNAGQQFYNAVQALMQTDGLIIDFRSNFGGNMFLSDSALKVLFTSSMLTIDWGRRTSPSNHLQMTLNNVSSNYKIKGTPPGYLKPIAVLTGPGAGSSGDQVAFRMKFHPRVKFFGKPTNGAFNSPVSLNLHADWQCTYSPVDAFDMAANKYLTHLESTVDQNVWLTKDGVAQGRDDVVEAAVTWLNLFSGTGTTLLTDNAEGGFGKWVTNQGWNVIKSNAHSPVYSFTESPKGNYKNGADNSLTLKNSINVSSYDAVILSFWHKYATQTDRDFCRVEVSSNNGTTWQQAVSYSGTVSTLHECRIDITRYANHSSSLKIRFRLTADASTNADGWYVDDIVMTGYNYGGQAPFTSDNNGNPQKYSLSQNYPNPFNPATKINYSLAVNGLVSIKIYDILGREVKQLVNEVQNAGQYNIEWNASDYPSGVYFYRIESGSFSETKKMMLIK
ncbi:MAG: T9SS C-terminal target domain-containing protein [Ignavibacteriae bacterium]|nr:MAG: T9SS C-terminal target domain-containing protein [Ignavibacteriota bacterium]